MLLCLMHCPPHGTGQTFKFAYEAAGRLTAPSPPSFLGRLFGRASPQPTVRTIAYHTPADRCMTIGCMPDALASLPRVTALCM